mgnify:CR=1 FL=1
MIIICFLINNEAPAVFVLPGLAFFVCLRPSQGKGNLNFNFNIL